MNKDYSVEYFINKMLNNQNNSYCPIRKSLSLLSGKWTTYVIYELFKKEHCRFNELKKAIPTITNTMLTTTLRDLEKKEIVNRIQYNEIPPHVEYSLTQKGKDLFPIFYEIGKWSEKYEKE